MYFYLGKYHKFRPYRFKIKIVVRLFSTTAKHQQIHTHIQHSKRQTRIDFMVRNLQSKCRSCSSICDYTLFNFFYFVTVDSIDGIYKCLKFAAEGFVDLVVLMLGTYTQRTPRIHTVSEYSVLTYKHIYIR